MIDAMIDPEEIAPPLLRWFDAHGRSLPWRGLDDLYAVWVSEIILQQTRVETGLRYFEPFLRRFPTVRALAEASEQEVLAQWSGLGFYRRARSLHRAARQVLNENGGEIPTDPAGFGALPGVGRYTVGAVLSSALDARLPIVDGNVTRVLSRLFLVRGPPDRAPVRRRLWALAEAVLPHERPGDFNQALMDLGAILCTPTGPACRRCPLADACAARGEGCAEDLPTPTRRSRVLPQERVALLILRADGRFLLRQRPEEGLLASLWELPSVEADQDAAPRAARALAAEAGGGPPGYCGTVEHRFSHRHWTVRVYRSEAVDPVEGRWIGEDELGTLGVPTASRKAIRAGLEGEVEGPPGGGCLETLGTKTLSC